MKTISLRIALFILCISCCILVSSVTFAQGIYDGLWAGITLTGEYIEFTVEYDIVTELYYSSRYDCPTGSTSNWGHWRYASAQVTTEGRFTVFQDIEGGHIRDGSTFPSIIKGQFESSTTATGSIKAGMAAYRGIDLLTQSCLFIDNWTAEKIADVPKGSDSKEEYDRKLD